MPFDRRGPEAKKGERPQAPERREREPEQAEPEGSVAEVLQRASSAPRSMSSRDVVQLQRTLGNRAVNSLLAGTQGGAGARGENRTGLPDTLKAGIESLSGVSLDGVRVHYNSSSPAQVEALAFTRGADIHLGPGQERHLPHEAWHAVQQMQSRIAPTAQVGGVFVNDDPALEREADAMGARAVAVPPAASFGSTPPFAARPAAAGPAVVQRVREGGEERSLYHEDEYNRPIRAESVVGQVEGIRNEEAQTYVSGRVNVLLETVFAGSGKEPYHAGHLITRHHGGFGDTRNLVPMPRSYNTGIATKRTSKKLDEEGRPKFWGPEDERYSDFEGRIDDLVGQAKVPLTMTVQVKYGPDDPQEFLAQVLDKGSLTLAQREPPSGVHPEAWRYAMQALFRHIHRTLRTIPFEVVGVVSQGSATLSTHVASRLQLLQLDQPWVISAGFLTGLAKDLASANIKSSADIDAILSTRCGYVAMKSDLPQYFDAGSDRTAMFSGRRDYDAAVHELFAQAPPTGILKTYDNNGVAGGVDAFIWMDPKGTARFRYGGSQPSVSPKGFTWRILEAARPGSAKIADRNKMYVRAHLLNGLLHGPGDDPENLVPFVDAANTRMEKDFESIVKRHPALYRQFTTQDVGWIVDEKGPVVTTWYGIWWHSRAVNKVQRPKDYPPLAVAAAMPAHPAVILAREEEKMPQGLELKAHQARFVRKSRGDAWTLEVGDLIVSHREWNSLQGGPILEETNPGTGLDVTAIGIAQRMARERTFANSAKEVAALAQKALTGAGYKIAVDGNKIQATSPTGVTFSLSVSERGQRMADVRVSSPQHGSIDQKMDALSEEVRLLDFLESKIPVVDTGALKAAAEDPAALAKLRLTYITRVIATLRSAMGKAQLVNPKWSSEQGPGHGLAGEVDKLEMMLDLAEPDGAPEDSLPMLDDLANLVQSLRGKVAKALAGTGVTLDDEMSFEFSASSFSKESGFSSGYQPPVGSKPAGNGYFLTPGHQARLTELHRTNVPIAPDGDCLFASLIAMGAFHGTIKEFRDFVADRVADGRINVAPFLLDPATTAKEIRTLGSYNNLSGDSTPSMIAQALNVNLRIINENGTVTRLDALAVRTYTLIRFLSPGAHYHATQSTGG